VKPILFLFILFIIGCKPEDPPFHCDIEYHPIPPTNLSFIEGFENYEQLYFRNLSSNNTFPFNTSGTVIYQIIDTTNNGRCYTYDYGGIVFTNENTSTLIEYDIAAEFHENNNFQIRIAPFNQQSSCTSIFYFTINTDTIDSDSIQISNKVFYNVFYRTDNLGCASEIYYNKQYGVVSFNWLGEWYVLETDSL